MNLLKMKTFYSSITTALALMGTLPLPHVNSFVGNNGGIRTKPIISSTSTTEVYMNKKRSSSSKKKSGSSGKGFASALRELQTNAFPFAGTVLPGKQSPQKVVVEEGIMKPDYAVDGKVRKNIKIFL